MHSKKIIYTLLTILLFVFAVYPQINEGVDPNFVPIITKTPSDVSLAVSAKLQPDGKLLVFGNILNGLVRYNTNGILDTSFLCTGCGTTFITSVAFQSDGKILAAGSTRETFPKPRIIRLNTDGSLDSTFSTILPINAPATGSITVLDIQSDGKIYIKANSSFQGNVFGKVYRLNANGSIDNSFSLGGISASQAFTKLKILSDGRVFIFGQTPYGNLAQINTDGSENSSFEKPSFTSQTLQNPPNISSIVLQSNGKLVIAGQFDTVNGISRANLARLNADSSVDMTFNPSFPPLIGFNVGLVELLSGDKLLFAQLSSFAMSALYRLNSDGTIDNSYTPPPNYSNFTDVDAQDRAYFVRQDSSTNRYSITRLNSDGTLDTTYNPVLDTLGSVNVLAIQPDGKIIAAGNLERVNGFSSSGVARINPNGTVDNSFSVSGISPDSIRDIAIQSDGKVLVGGTNGLVRLNSNGSSDTSFTTNTTNVNTIALQSDGKILIGGTFSSVNGVSRTSIARVNSDGTLDTTFNPVLSGGATVNDIIWQTDGKIVFGGSFTGVNGFNRSNLARLNADGSLDTGFSSTLSGNQIIRQPGRQISSQKINKYCQSKCRRQYGQQFYNCECQFANIFYVFATERLDCFWRNFPVGK